ncbi:MAG: c-type cytochrome domain-containing protein [Kofleriaceae bacterium]
MKRLVVACGVVLGGCGTTDDDRPQTLENVTLAILSPSCGNAQCHSSFRQADGYAFDTVAAAKKSIEQGGLVVEGDGETSQLYIVLRRTVDRMPYDQPLPEPDIQFIKTWIDNGADGVEP